MKVALKAISVVGGALRAIVGLVLASCCVVVGGWASAQAEKRVALIVGNSAYAHISGLPNVPNDAAAIAALLKSARFEAVDVVHNAGVADLRRALKAFAGKAAGADVAVLYYAGHGIEVGQTNYLIPVDARLATDFDIEDETVPLDRVLQALAPAKRLRLVLLDACRENPFLKSMKRTVATRTVGRGLGRIEPAATNTLIAFATKPNAVAEDGKGRNSPFTAALVKHLLTPGLDLRIALGKVRDEVMAATGGRQEPYVTSSLGGEVVAIVPGVPGAGSADARSRPNEVATLGAKRIELLLEAQRAGVLSEKMKELLEEAQRRGLVPPPLLVSPKTAGPVIGTSNPKREAVPLAAAEERALRPKDTFKECSDCPEMVAVPAGSFTMGLLPNEAGGADEVRQHQVTFARPFAVGKFEVTRGEFATFVRESGLSTGDKCSIYQDGQRQDRSGRSFRNPDFMQDDRHPAVCVSWTDATAYVGWLSRKTGKTYRLPTEAEWEYAARGVTSSAAASLRFWWGDQASREYANYGNDDATTGYQRGRDQWEHTAPVGQFPANPFGLHDMHGNVWEWVQECYHYDNRPSAQTKGDCPSRILRGGWLDQQFRSPALGAALLAVSHPPGQQYRLSCREDA